MKSRSIIHLIILYIIGISLLTSCHEEHDEPKKTRQAAHTVILYQIADNNLSSLLWSDLQEVVAGRSGIPDSCNVIVYHDNYDVPKIYKVTARKGLEEWYAYPQEMDSCDSLNVLNTLSRITKAFPARHYSLIMSSHGSGWIPQRNKTKRHRTIGVDRGSELDIVTLRHILEQLPHMDYIFFDACFMQSVETAYELRHVTDWTIGSPAEIPGYGAPYDKITNALCTSDIPNIVGIYHQGYPNSYTTCGVVLSAIRTDKLEQLSTATQKVVPEIFRDKFQMPTLGLQNYSPMPSFTYCFDMKKTMHTLLDEEAYTTWENTFEEAVPYHPETKDWYSSYKGIMQVYDPEHCGSVAMFIPLACYEPDGWNQAMHRLEWYKAAGWDLTGW